MFLEHRTFVDQMDRESDGFFVASEDFPVVPGDRGVSHRSDREIQKRTPASIREKKERSYRKSIDQELAYKESELTERDYLVYKDHFDKLKSSSDKLYYLNLRREERQSYLDSMSYPEPSKRVFKKQASVFSARTVLEEPELTMGMGKSVVVQLWGSPQIVEVAGNPIYENERWSYQRGHSNHYVFFEQGKVQGC